MKKQLFTGMATWLVAITAFTSSAPLVAGGETKGSSQEKNIPSTNIIIESSDEEGETSPKKKKGQSTLPEGNSSADSPKTPSSHGTISTDVSPEKEKTPLKKPKNFSSNDDSDDDVSSGNKRKHLKKLKSFSLSDDSGNDSDGEKKEKEDFVPLRLEDLKQIKDHKTTLYPHRKISESEQQINFKDSFKKKTTGSDWFCKSIYNQTCSLARQFVNANLINGDESGGTFHRNVENLVCETNLFNEWLFLDGQKVKRIFAGGENSEYLEYRPCNNIFFKVNADKDNIALVGSSYLIPYAKGKSLNTINKGKHIFQVLERLTASMPWVKKFLLPITVEIYTEKGPQLSHQLLMELNTGKNPSIFIWDSLSEMSTKDIKPIVEQVISEIKSAQIKLTSRTEDGLEILEVGDIISKHLNLHTAPMTYQQLSFQLPGTGNCTRFALFFAFLRSESEDLQQYTVDTGNRFCTFVKGLDPKW